MKIHASEVDHEWLVNAAVTYSLARQHGPGFVLLPQWCRPHYVSATGEPKQLCLVFMKRLPEVGHVIPLDEAETAIDAIRERFREWHNTCLVMIWITSFLAMLLLFARLEFWLALLPVWTFTAAWFWGVLIGPPAAHKWRHAIMRQPKAELDRPIADFLLRTFERTQKPKLRGHTAGKLAGGAAEIVGIVVGQQVLGKVLSLGAEKLAEGGMESALTKTEKETLATIFREAEALLPAVRRSV